MDPNRVTCRHCCSPYGWKGTNLCDGCWEAVTRLQHCDTQAKINILKDVLKGMKPEQRKILIEALNSEGTEL